MVKGAALMAQALQEQGVRIVFSLPGLPVVEIGEECMKIGIRFITFRNEQAAVYAATAYGYLTGRPGVCTVVGGPGVLHVMAGIPHAMANSWPLLVLGGSSETHNAGRGAFQEMDAIPMITPISKLAVRPPYPNQIKKFIKDAYRTAMFGRPGPTFVDCPADKILGHFDVEETKLSPIPEIPLPTAPERSIRRVADVMKGAKAPLVVIGKGAAYARAEHEIRALIDNTGLPFFPSPMGKGVVPDASEHNVSSARSTAMKEADVVLVLGARLNWILTFGQAPKWNPNAKIIQVDLHAEELGTNGGDPTLGLVGDIRLVVEQLVASLKGWRWEGNPNSDFYRKLKAARSKNEEKAAKKAAIDKIPMTFEKIFDVMQKALHSMSKPEDGDIVYVSEGANAMDISRSIISIEHPRIKLDAGTYATMGVGLGYAIASWLAYNVENPEGSSGSSGRKKVVCIEGDSAFGFSGMEVETMSRYNMDILIFVLNNSGLYRGDASSKEGWNERQKVTLAGETAVKPGLSGMSLGYETNYEKIAEMVGGIGIIARTPEELKKATETGFKATVPVVINIIVDTGSDVPMDFSWLDMAPPKSVREQKL